MDKQKEMITELTPEQMDIVTGGTGNYDCDTYICSKCFKPIPSPAYLSHWIHCTGRQDNPQPQPDNPIGPVPIPVEDK